MNYIGFETSEALHLKIDRYYAYRYDGFSMRRHAHLNAEIMLAESGESDVFVGENEEKVPLGADSFIFLSSMVPHRLRIRKNAHCKILNLEVRPDDKESAVFDYARLLGDYPALAFAFNQDGFVSAPDAFGVKALLQEIQTELTGYSPLSALAVQAKLLSLFIAVARSVSGKAEHPAYCVKSALEYVARTFSQGVTPALVAGHTGLHPVYLERQIKKHTGKTLLRHINEQRVAYAKKLMDNTSLPLTDIAFECGFNTRQNFYETFKKMEGVSPKECRMRLSKEVNRYNRAPFEQEDGSSGTAFDASKRR